MCRPVDVVNDIVGNEPRSVFSRAIRPCAAYRGRHKYISYISDIRLTPCFFYISRGRAGRPACKIHKADAVLADSNAQRKH